MVILSTAMAYLLDVVVILHLVACTTCYRRAVTCSTRHRIYTIVPIVSRYVMSSFGVVVVMTLLLQPVFLLQSMNTVG